MSVLRRAAFRLPVGRAAPAARVAHVRFASGSPSIDPEVAKAFEPLRVKDPRIPSDTVAFEIPVPANPPETDFLKRRKSVEEHSVHTTDLWRKISIYVCIPAIIVAAIYVYKLEAEHEEHLQHLIDENGGQPPERKVYSYMNIRTKKFPWGNQSLFFNPRYNIPAEDA